jgi:hypothetical protein
VVDESIWLERPGKNQGSTSANLKVINGVVLFYVYTSSAPPFKEMHAHNAFTVRTFLKHDGDFKSCAAALRAEGYGKQSVGEDEHKPSQLDYCAEFARRNAQTWAYDGELDVWREWNDICWALRVNDSAAYLSLGQFIQSYGKKPVNSDGTVQSALKMLRRFMLRPFEEASGLINFTNGTLELTREQ